MTIWSNSTLFESFEYSDTPTVYDVKTNTDDQLLWRMYHQFNEDKTMHHVFFSQVQFTPHRHRNSCQNILQNSRLFCLCSLDYIENEITSNCKKLLTPLPCSYHSLFFPAANSRYFLSSWHKPIQYFNQNEVVLSINRPIERCAMVARHNCCLWYNGRNTINSQTQLKQIFMQVYYKQISRLLSTFMCIVEPHSAFSITRLTEK